ncbi:MAG: hypothetical protein ACQEV0_09745 [Bacillota bacterium]
MMLKQDKATFPQANPRYLHPSLPVHSSKTVQLKSSMYNGSKDSKLLVGEGKKNADHFDMRRS